MPYKAKISGEFDSTIDPQTAKLKGGPQILVTLSFRELCDSTLPDLCTFNYIAILLSWKTESKSER